MSEGKAVPDSYWYDDCPCAIAGERQPECTTCPDYGDE